MTLHWAKIFSILGLACYLSIATLNNFVDQSTNRYLLKQMTSMELLQKDPIFGQGLIKRAIHSEHFVNYLLNLIIIIEATISFLLFYGAYLLIRTDSNHILFAINKCNFAVVCFMSLWFFFWCGGLWFGYWMKTGQIQEVHMRLIIISLLELIFLNLNI